MVTKEVPFYTLKIYRLSIIFYGNGSFFFPVVWELLFMLSVGALITTPCLHRVPPARPSRARPGPSTNICPHTDVIVADTKPGQQAVLVPLRHDLLHLDIKAHYLKHIMN